MLELLRTQPAFLAGVAGIFGLVVGSFLNVVIYRVPRMMERAWLTDIAELLRDRAWPVPGGLAADLAARPARYNLMVPGSGCPSCGRPIRALENIPVVSYLVLRGRCAGCSVRISPRYPLVEAVSGLLAMLTAWRFGFSFAALAAMVLCWSLVALAVIDFDTQFLPDSITLPLVWFGLAFNLFGALTDLQSAVIGAMAGYLVLWCVYWLFKFATGREGMGYGDFKLLAALGAFLGWQMLPLIVLLSSVVGAVIGIGLIVLARHGRQVPMPFGPYLAIAGLVAMFAGGALTRAYFELF